MDQTAPSVPRSHVDLTSVRRDDWIIVLTVSAARVRARRRRARAVRVFERLADDSTTRSADVLENGPERVVLTMPGSDVDTALDLAEEVMRRAGRRSLVRAFVCARRRPETLSQTLLRARAAELRAGRTPVRATLVS